MSDGRSQNEQLVDVLGGRHPGVGAVPAAVDGLALLQGPRDVPVGARRRSSRRTGRGTNYDDRLRPRAVHLGAAELVRHLDHRHRCCRWSSRCSRRTPSPDSTSPASGCCCRWRSPSRCSRRPPWSVRCSTCGASLGIYDTWIGLIIPYLTFALPLSIWTMSAFFRQIPWEMEQAAQVDGATSVAGVPQGDRAPGRAGRVHHGDPHVLLLLERVPARRISLTSTERGPHRARRALVLHRRTRSSSPRSPRSWPRRSSSPSPS